MGNACVLSNETQHLDLWGMTGLHSHMYMMQRCSPSVLQTPPPSRCAKDLLAMAGGKRSHWSEAWTKKAGSQYLQYVTMKTFVTQLFPAELLTDAWG